jgi:hypothetical protein
MKSANYKPPYHATLPYLPLCLSLNTIPVFQNITLKTDDAPKRRYQPNRLHSVLTSFSFRIYFAVDGQCRALFQGLWITLSFGGGGTAMKTSVPNVIRIGYLPNTSRSLTDRAMHCHNPRRHNSLPLDTLVVPARRFPQMLWYKSQSRNRPWRPIGLPGVQEPTLFRQSAHRLS